MDPNQALTNFDGKNFKQLLESQTLVDCTLACDGGKISAHKIVLSACSAYLAKILHEHPVEHPIIILPELNIDDVKTLVHYMYTGELLKSVALNSTSLIRTAAILCVNSINDFFNMNQNTSNNNNNESNTPNLNNINDDSPDEDSEEPLELPQNVNHDHQQQQEPSALQLTQGRRITNNSPLVPNSLSIIQQSLLQTDQRNNNNNDMNINNTNDDSALNNFSSYSYSSSMNRNINNLSTTKSDFQFKCPVCHNDFQTICSFEYHMQRVHSVTQFGCEICHKPFASLRYVLTDHMKRCHNWKAEHKLEC